MKIETVAVLGASGTVGSLTGGVLAQNGLKVYFLSRSMARSQKGLDKAMAQARSEVIADNIICGDYDTLLQEACGQADWILECVAEDVAVKRSLYEQVDRYRRPGSIVSSVTSSLVLEELPKGRSEDFCRHFLSTHFYNPPAKMLACEICGQSRTDPEVVAFMAEFLDKRLRRAVIPVKPTAGFAGNRIAFLLFARITELAVMHGVEMMDYLIGPYTGRIMPPLATLDLVGLDIHAAIIRSLQRNVSDAMHDRITLPAYVEAMIQAGHLGRKSRDKGGFYKRLESGKNVFVDPATLDYVGAFDPHVQFVEQAKGLIRIGKYRQAFEVILAAVGSEAEIVKEILATYIAYSYMLIGQVTDEEYGIGGIDRVMTTGYNWAGPSMIVKMLGGKDRAIELLQSQNLPVPDSLRSDIACEQTIFNVGKYFPAK